MLTATPPPASTPQPRAPSGLTGPGRTATWGSAPPQATRARRSAPGPWATAGARASATRVSVMRHNMMAGDNNADWHLCSLTFHFRLSRQRSVLFWRLRWPLCGRTQAPRAPDHDPLQPPAPAACAACGGWGRVEARGGGGRLQLPHTRGAPGVPQAQAPSARAAHTIRSPSDLNNGAHNNALLIPSSSRNCHISCQPLSRALSVYCVCNNTNITVYCLSGMHTLLLI